MDEDWSVSPVTERMRDKAWAQLGTSGTGNHFVEFGSFTADAAQAKALGIAPGEYLALLTHSGSRGTGAQVAISTAKWPWHGTRNSRKSSSISPGSRSMRKPGSNTGPR
jgi:RNA-splicing ligase RtcB